MSSIRVRPLRSLLTGLALCASFCLLPTPSAQAEEGAQETKPILHAAVSETDTILLVGTLHTRHKDVVAVHPTTARALEVADVLVAEIAFDDTLSLRMLPYIQLPRNRPLDSLLGEGLKKRIETLLAKHDDDLDSWQRYAPWLLEARLGELLLPGDELVKTTLDEALQEKAADRDLEVLGLEKLSEQLAPFKALSYEDQVAMLEDTVTLIEKDQAAGRNTARDMVRAWQSGDANAVMAQVKRYFDMDNERDRALFTAMHDTRNERMLARLLDGAKASPNQVRLVAVGTAHLPGETGLLKGLAENGYVVWPLTAAGDVPATHADARSKAAAVSPPAIEATPAAAPAAEEQIAATPAMDDTPIEPTVVDTPAPAEPAGPVDPNEVVVFNEPVRGGSAQAPRVRRRMVPGPAPLTSRRTIIVYPQTAQPACAPPPMVQPACVCPPRPCRPRRCWPFPFGRRR